MERYSENNYLEDEELAQLQAQQQDEIPQQSAPPIVDEEELLAAQAAAEAAAAQQQQQPGGAFNNVGQGLTGRNRDIMMQYWQETINSIEHDDHDFKNHQLPLARIKKVMKTDEDVRMISAEAPILFAKGCDVFITELTMRAWIHAEENKRRTLQKSDIANALTKSDMFDFLIDVVPREEEKPKKPTTSRSNGFSTPRSNPQYQDQYQQETNFGGQVPDQEQAQQIQASPNPPQLSSQQQGQSSPTQPQPPSQAPLVSTQQQQPISTQRLLQEQQQDEQQEQQQEQIYQRQDRQSEKIAPQPASNHQQPQQAPQEQSTSQPGEPGEYNNFQNFNPVYENGF